MIAAAISAIILSFMASTRAGLWCVVIEVLMLLGLMIAGIRGTTYNNCLGIFGIGTIYTLVYFLSPMIGQPEAIILTTKIRGRIIPPLIFVGNTTYLL